MKSDPAMRDQLWEGYHPRAVIPILVAVALASLIVWTGQWYQSDLSNLADRIGSLALFALAWGVWPALICVILYRTITYTYRITDRALLIDFGFLSRPAEPLTYSTVISVEDGGNWLFRQLGIGWVEIRTTDRNVRIPGVRHPSSFAQAIRDAIAKWAKDES